MSQDRDQAKEDPIPPKKRKTKEKEDENSNDIMEKTEADLDDGNKRQEEFEMILERLLESNPELYNPALVQLRAHIKASTTLMTSVPKPLKFLRKHYDALQTIYEKITDDVTKKKCADVISVLAMTLSDKRDCLKYKILGENKEIGDWGHEYVRNLTREISQEWLDKDISEEQKGILLSLAEKIVPYNLDHNAEAEACDLAMELEHLDLLERFVKDDSNQRVCFYLCSRVAYVPDPENMKLLRTALAIYRKFEKWPQALRVAMQLNDATLVSDIVRDCPDATMRKQLAFMIGRQQINVEIPESMPDEPELRYIVTNSLLNGDFLALGRELEILEASDGVSDGFGPENDAKIQETFTSLVSKFFISGPGYQVLRVLSKKRERKKAVQNLEGAIIMRRLWEHLKRQSNQVKENYDDTSSTE